MHTIEEDFNEMTAFTSSNLGRRDCALNKVMLGNDGTSRKISGENSAVDL